MNTTITNVGLAAILTTLVGCTINDASQSSMGIPSFQNTEETNLAKLAVQACNSPMGVTNSNTTATIIQSVVSASLNWFGTLAKSKLNDDINNTILTFNLDDPSKLSGQCLTVTRSIGSQTIDGRPDLLFSAEIVTSEKYPNYITFVPTAFAYAGYTPKDTQKRKPRDVSVALGVAKPDTTIDYDNRDKTKTIGRLLNFGTITQPGDPKAIYTASFSDNGLGQGTQWMNVSTDTPVTLVVQVIESTKPNQIVKILAQTYVANEETINEAVLALDVFQSKEALKQAQVDSEQKAISARTDYYNSLDEVASAKDAINVACDKLTTEEQGKVNSEIAKLQRAYDLKLRQSHLESKKAGLVNSLPTSSPSDGICKS